MEDILDAVPIDKYFELFKPGAGGEGGFIRVAMNYDTQMLAADGGVLACLPGVRVFVMQSSDSCR